MSLKRREFLEIAGKFLFLSAAAQIVVDNVLGAPTEMPDKYKAADRWWGMIVDVSQCIGCGNCVRGCAAENGVPKGYFRTWVERYHVTGEGIEHPEVDSPNGAFDGFPPKVVEGSRGFFVPKLCNHCVDSPCVQACPVGATFDSPDGVVLVDKSYCVGCRYCVQACPYGCRYIDPQQEVVDKCTLCYHRITQGLTTACAEVCPTGARRLCDFKDPNDPVHEFLRTHSVQVLKPHLATRSKVYYKDLDGAVR